jgi:hypothetical protein
MIVWTLLLSGVIHVEPRHVPFLAGLAVAILGMSIARSLEVGAETANRLFRNSGAMVAMAILAGTLAFFLLPEGIRPDVIVAVNAVTVVLILRLLLRWPFRERWAGRLLVDLARPRPNWVFLLAGAAVVGAIGSIVERRSGVQLRHIALAGQSMLLGIWVIVFHARTEIRERGLLAMGQCIAWRSIEAHWWDYTSGDNRILRVQCGGWRRIGSPLSVTVPAHLKDQVDAVMRRYMGELPER